MQASRKHSQKTRLGSRQELHTVFDNEARGCLDSPVLNPKQSGELQIVLNFGAPPGNNITVILYGEFEHLLEIDENRAMLYDIYQH